MNKLIFKKVKMNVNNVSVICSGNNLHKLVAALRLVRLDAGGTLLGSQAVGKF